MAEQIKSLSTAKGSAPKAKDEPKDEEATKEVPEKTEEDEIEAARLAARESYLRAWPLEAEETR